MLASILLSTCQKQQQIESGDEKVVTLTFWHSMVSSSALALEKLIKRFEAEYPNIRIKPQYVPSGNALLQKLITAVQSCTTPDISWLYAGCFGDLVKADAIYDIDYFLKGSDTSIVNDLNDVFPALIRLGSSKGTLYSIPMEATNFGLLYNRDLFRQGGLDPDKPPKNWDELVSYSRALTVDRNNDKKYDQVGILLPVHPADGPLGGFMVWHWVAFLWQAGGYVINEDQTRVLFNSSAGREALDLWKTIYNNLALSSFTADQDMAFASQMTAMILDGPWNLPRYDKLLHKMDWAVAPLPEGQFQRATNTGGEFLVIFKQSKHPQEAWEFVKWIIQPEIQAFWSMESGYLPVRRAVLNIQSYQDYLEKHPNFRVYVEQMKFARSTRSIDNYSQEIDRLLANAIEKATVGKMESQGALDEAAARANRLLSTNY